MNDITDTASIQETPFMAQRRTLRELKEKQDAGEATPMAANTQITPKAQARRNAEATASKKKVSKKKAGKVTTE